MRDVRGAAFVGLALAGLFALQGGKEIWTVSLAGAASVFFAARMLAGELASESPRLPAFPVRAAAAAMAVASLPGLLFAAEPFAARLEWTRCAACLPFALVAVRAFAERPHVFWLGVVALCDAEALAGFALGSGRFPGRAAGTMPNPTLFCEAVCAGLAAALALLAESRPLRLRDRRTLFLAASALLCLAAGLASGSRVLPLCAGAGTAVAAFRALRLSTALPLANAALAASIAGGVLAGAVWSLPGPLSARVSSLGAADPFANLRPRIWSATLSMARDHPAGVGWGGYATAFRRYAFPVEGAVARNGMTANFAHNEYLHALAEGGAPAAAGLAFLLAAGSLAAWRRLRDPRSPPVVAPAAACAVSLLAGATVDFNWHPPSLALLLAAAAAFVWSDGEREAPLLARLRAATAGRAPTYAWIAGTAGALWMALSACSQALHASADRLGVRGAGDAEILSRLRAAIWLAPSWKVPWISVGNVQHERYRRTRDPEAFQAAESAFSEAAALSRLDPDPHARRAALLTDAWRVEPSATRRSDLAAGARRGWSQALQREPLQAFHQYRRAELDLAEGRRGDAVVGFEKAAALEPNFAAAHDRLAQLLRASMPETARQHARAAQAAAALLSRCTTDYERSLVARAPAARERTRRR